MKTNDRPSTNSSDQPLTNNILGCTAGQTDQRIANETDHCITDETDLCMAVTSDCSMADKTLSETDTTLSETDETTQPSTNQGGRFSYDLVDGMIKDHLASIHRG